MSGEDAKLSGSDFTQGVEISAIPKTDMLLGAGTASEGSNLLRSMDFYKDQEVELTLGARVNAINVHHDRVEMADGSSHPFGALVLATGAEPVRLAIPGGTLPHVHHLRTVSDSRAIVAKALESKRAVVIGSSFIGLEVAASLRARNVERA